MRAVGRLLAVVLAGAGLVVPQTPAHAVVPCSAGLVALTFDDGPSPTATRRLVRILDDLRVPATFFMVGERVAAAPATARLVARHGYAVGNHSYRHRLMTSQSSADIRRTLWATDRELRAAGVTPTRLMRPPYGGMNTRVESVIRGAGFVPVLWDVDSRDWEGDPAGVIADRILARLRPDRSNVVLQHDGIRNSPASIDAVPRVVRAARNRGFCFAKLNASGRMAPPVPRARVAALGVREGNPVWARVVLDRPTSRPTSVLLTTVAGSARAGSDFVAKRVRVWFPVGRTRAVVRIPTVADSRDEWDERFRVRLLEPRRLTIARASTAVEIRDDDPPPGVSVLDASVVEPVTGSAPAAVRVVLDRVSGREVRVDLTTVSGTADSVDFSAVSTTVVIPAGQREVSVPVAVLADALEEPDETFTVQITQALRAVVLRPVATVTILAPLETDG
jgi:peptidoglycan/xylan/chitin deacetylase (PgdA/CDA1 family)